MRKERERERAHHRRPTSFDFAGDPETSRHEPTNQSSTLLANPEPRSCHEHRAFDLEPEPSTHRSSTQSLRPTSLQLCQRPRVFDFTGNPRTDLSLYAILIFVVVVVVWVVVFWWFSYCVVVGFACLPLVVAFDCRSLLPWVKLEFRWCVVLFRWWV